MKKLFPIGILLVVLGLAFVALGVLGKVELVSGCVLGGLTLLLSIPCVVVGNIGRSFERDAARVRELAVRGRRIQGHVLDALPMTSPHGNPVFQAGGAQMVLRVEVFRGQLGKQTVTLHVVEDSEASRARIGKEVTLVEHPDDPALRALEGYLPNGIRA